MASIVFIQYFIDHDYTKALQLLEKPPLNKTQLKESFKLLQDTSSYKIVTVDKQGAFIYMDPENLTRLFVQFNLSSSADEMKKEPLLSYKHTNTIADYIND